jgi:dephospho-CoA kinase
MWVPNCRDIWEAHDGWIDIGLFGRAGIREVGSNDDAGPAARLAATELWRRFADQLHKDRNDRTVLQQLGQALVLTKPGDFVNDVLHQQPGAEHAENVIVDGVRHVEILLELKKQAPPRTLKLIHIKADSETRQERLMRRDRVERRLIARYDSDITEAQVARILPQYADLTIDGSLPVELLVDQVIGFVRNWTQIPEALSA